MVCMLTQCCIVDIGIYRFAYPCPLKYLSAESSHVRSNSTTFNSMALSFEAMNIFARSNHSNTSVGALQVFCGYPLSHPYQLMPRIVLYPLVWLAFFSRTALVVVILWTSVAAIHVIELAKSHSYSALDLDMFPAYRQVLLGTVCGPSYIILSRGFKKGWRVDVFGACVWLVPL